MAIHPNFADWYRSAALTPPEGLLEKRWAGVEAVVKKPSASLVLSLAKLFSLPNATESFVPAGFRDPFRNDESFPSKNNVQELRVLAGAVLRVMVEQHQPLSPLSALALVSGSFGPREAASLEAGHLENAQRFLLQHAAATRRTIRPEPLKIPAFTKEKLAEKLPQLAETITEITAEFSSTLKQAQIAIGQLAHVATVREEEVAILWWLQARFSGIPGNFQILDACLCSRQIILVHQSCDIRSNIAKLGQITEFRCSGRYFKYAWLARIRTAVAAIAGASFRGRRGDAADRGVVLYVADQIVEPRQ